MAYTFDYDYIEAVTAFLNGEVQSFRFGEPVVRIRYQIRLHFIFRNKAVIFLYLV